MRVTTRLRKLLEGPRILLAPGAYDALSAKLIQEEGFDAVYMTGAGVTISLLGEPGVGLTTMTEVVDQTRRIVAATLLPVALGFTVTFLVAQVWWLMTGAV